MTMLIHYKAPYNNYNYYRRRSKLRIMTMLEQSIGNLRMGYWATSNFNWSQRC